VRRWNALVLVLASACGGTSTEWRYTTPRVVDEAALLAALRPEREGERVLANFWASW
jgi:hypothetical protein